MTARGQVLTASLKCPRFIFDGVTVGGDAPQSIGDGNLAAGELVETSFPRVRLGDGSQLEVRLFLQWSARESVLRKWAAFRLADSNARRVLKEVILEDLDLEGRAVQAQPGQVQSYPAFLAGFFLGIEFPVASTRLQEGHLLLAHRPGLRMRPGTWYQTRKAVFGAAAGGDERSAFTRYIAAHRPGAAGIHVNYNSWWTSPTPYSERDILGLMQAFETNLYRRHGVSFDTFCIDMGWSSPRSLWQIDSGLFPEGFAGIRRAAERMHCHLGLWISPSSCYGAALDNEWVREQGYETFAVPWGGDQKARFACLGGRRYRERFQQGLVEMVTRYGIRHIKFDGYLFECPESGHGHEPGPLSSEAIADGIIQVFQAVRKAAPDIWLEPTCFGWNPSPWWLFYVNSVIGTYGDDAPYGRVPAPVHRESYTTARDYYNLQGAHYLDAPIAMQEVLGIVHQSGEPFLNDAVMTVMRGHMFLPIYLNPAHMSEARWKALADLLKWARANAPLLAETQPLLPDSWLDGKCPALSGEAPMPREPYGYAHWKGNRGLIAVRNPWIIPRTISLRLDGNSGTPPGLRAVDAVSIYPEVRLYGRGLHFGGALSVPVAPYETVVLSIAARQSAAAVPEAREVIRRRIGASPSKRELSRVEFEGGQASFGPDFTCLLGEARSAVRVQLEANVTIAAPQAELLVLLEGKVSPAPLVGHIRSNGKELPISFSGSDTGWASSGGPKPEHWLFLRAPLVPGDNNISLELVTGAEPSKVSAWVWATRSGKPGRVTRPNALPEPDVVSLDAAALLEPVDVSALPAAREKVAPPVERIDGVFLDSINPVSVSQGWGILQRNESVWERPLTIAGKRYLRGLGTHAPSRLVFVLDGKYRRFQSWAGADGATTPTITFEVLVDGRKRWETGVMRRDEPARWVDIDVAGAKTLELIVGDGGNGIACDHADWADARLLR